MEITISSASQLKAELRKDISQDTTFKLEAGTYTGLNLSGKKYAALSKANGFDVTITSADATDPAILSGTWITDAANVTFDAVRFEYAQKPMSEKNAAGTQLAAVVRSDNVSIINTTFEGGETSGLPDKVSSKTGLAFDENNQHAGLGVRFVESTDVTLRGNLFKDLWKGAVFTESRDTKPNDGIPNILLERNELVGLASDGFAFWNVHGVKISENYFHDFERNLLSNQHADMIQVFHNSKRNEVDNFQKSSDIEISNNVFDSGTAPTDPNTVKYVHSILIGDSGVNPVAHSDITITDNWIKGSQANALSAKSAQNLTVTNNTFLKNLDTVPSLSQHQKFLDVKNGNTAGAGTFDLKIQISNGATDVGNYLTNAPTAAELANFDLQVDAIKTLLGSDLPTDPGTGGSFDFANYTAVSGLRGTSGDDLITGTSGNDRIKGGDGDDYIDAGTGPDWWVVGGDGSDIFEFGDEANVLAIAKNDWDDGQDLIRLTGTNDDGSAMTFDNLDYNESASLRLGVVQFDTEDGSRLIIRDVTIDQITAEDFI